MPRQKGIIPIGGKLGDVVGFKRGGKHFLKLAATKYHFSKESGKSGSEFGRGSKGSALIRRGFYSLMLSSFDGKLHNRLAERLRKIIRSGSESKKGQRGIFDGDIRLLKGFELSAYKSFHQLMALVPTIKRVSNTIEIELPAINWEEHVFADNSIDHAVLQLGYGFFDFTDEAYTVEKSNELRIDKEHDLQQMFLEIPITQNKEVALVIMMNLCFEVTSCPSKNRDYQVGIIIDALHLRNGKCVEFVPPAEEPQKVETFKVDSSATWEIKKNNSE